MKGAGEKSDNSQREIWSPGIIFFKKEKGKRQVEKQTLKDAEEKCL